MTLRRIVAFALAVGVLVPQGARAEDPRYLTPVFASATLTPSIVYGEARNNRDEMQALLLDLYEPAGDTAEARPMIVLAHGGGFTGGSRTDDSIVWYAREFAKRGFVTASISYRLRPAGTPGSPTMQDLIVNSLAGNLPDAMRDAQHDMQAAVRWARANAGTLRVDPDLIIAGGISAGASMSLEAAFNADDPGTSGTPGESSAVAAAVSVSGATDPRRVEPGPPPVVMFNGTNDSTAPFPTAIMACGAVIAMGATCGLTAFVFAGHDLDAYRQVIADEAARFLCGAVLSCD